MRISAIHVPIVIVLVVTLYLAIVGYIDFLTGAFAEWTNANL
ncbi:hypothetical protein [Natronococcus wangiae]